MRAEGGQGATRWHKHGATSQPWREDRGVGSDSDQPRSARAEGARTAQPGEDATWGKSREEDKAPRSGRDNKRLSKIQMASYLIGCILQEEAQPRKRFLMSRQGHRQRIQYTHATDHALPVKCSWG